MSMQSGQGGRPLSVEEKCTLVSLGSSNSYDPINYFSCLRAHGVQLFTPKQEMAWWKIILILLFVIFGGYYAGPLVLQLMGSMSVHQKYRKL